MASVLFRVAGGGLACSGGSPRNHWPSGHELRPWGGGLGDHVHVSGAARCSAMHACPDVLDSQIESINSRLGS